MEELKNTGIVPMDYSVLESMLTEYASPRNKVASLEKSRHLVRLNIKKSQTRVMKQDLLNALSPLLQLKTPALLALF